jgi:hypothetical protein
MFLRLVILILTFAVASNANASAFKEYWTSARAMGMGNAYSSVVSDADAIFYNPAALARNTGFNWTALDPRVGADRFDVVSEFQNFQDTDDIADYIKNHYGEQYWATGGMKSALTFPYFGMAAFATSEVSMFPTNPANPVIEIDYYADYGFALAGAFDVVPGVFSIGATGKRITRVGTSYPIGGSVLADLDPEEIEEELKNRGSGYALDAGLLITAPTPVKPSLAVVYKNIGYTTFSHEGGLRAPARMDPELSVSGSLKIDAALIEITPAFEYKYINEKNAQLGKKLHLGLEVSLPLIDIRAGLHQGYYTAGAAFDLGVLRIDAATYGVELGEYPGQHEDRRYMAQITFDIGFDVGSFSGKDSKTGKRTRLKQRR